jgi:hypothetical protein
VQRAEPLRGARGLLAGRIASLLAAAAGLHEAPKPRRHPEGPAAEGDPWLQAARLAYLVEEARRGRRPGEAVAGIAWWAAAVMGEDEVERGYLAPLPPPAPVGGFEALVRAAVRHALRGSLETLNQLLSLLQRELSTPCWRDPALARERERLEAAMKRLGLVLGVTLPVLFLAGFIYSPLLALASLVVAAALWAAVLRVGGRFRNLNLELAWRACTLDSGELFNAVAGRDLPSLAELVGVRELRGLP